MMQVAMFQRTYQKILLGWRTLLFESTDAHHHDSQDRHDLQGYIAVTKVYFKIQFGGKAKIDTVFCRFALGVFKYIQAL